MSTTYKYNFYWLIPLSLVNTPIPFSQFAKTFDADGIPTSFYSYAEWSALPGNAYVETPSKTHVILGHGVASIRELAKLFPLYLSNVDANVQWQI